MIYEKSFIEQEINRFLPTFPNHGHSKLAEIMQSSGALNFMSHRQLRKYIGDVREANKNVESGNILIVGDLHSPFILEGYLEFCKNLYTKHNCSRVIFIGDLLDFHANAFWTKDPDGYSAGDELRYAKNQLKPWYEAFPGDSTHEVSVLMGNHDFRIQRQAKAAGLSKHVLKPYKEVVEAPEYWKFYDNDLLLPNNILVTHGTIGDAAQRAKDSRQSVIQGHLHTKAYVQWFVSNIDKIFSMQVGVGFDRSSYAAAYASDNAKKPIIAAGLLIDGGKLPLVELMNL